MIDWVDPTPVREAFKRSGLSLSELARRADYNESHVARIVGDRVHYNYKCGRRYESPRRRLGERGATRLLRAMGLDPRDVGL